MSLSKFNENVNNHQSLPDKPTLPAEDLKVLWDKAVNDIKTYINTILTNEIDTVLETKANSSNVYAKTDVYNKTETYNKLEVYNKTEIDYVQTETINASNTNGQASIVFTRSGKIVTVTANITLNANKTSLNLSNNNFSMPNFAKVSSNKNLVSVTAPNGFGVDTSNQRLMITSIASLGIYRQNGNYGYSVVAQAYPSQSSSLTFIMRSSYIVD